MLAGQIAQCAAFRVDAAGSRHSRRRPTLTSYHAAAWFARIFPKALQNFSASSLSDVANGSYTAT